VWWLSNGACGAKKQGESFMLFFKKSFEVMLREYTSVVHVNAFTSTMSVNVKQVGNISYTLCKCINFIS